MKRTIILLSFILLLFSCSSPEAPKIEINTDSQLFMEYYGGGVSIKGTCTAGKDAIKVALDPPAGQWLQYHTYYPTEDSFEIYLTGRQNDGLRTRHAVVSLFVENSDEIHKVNIEQRVLHQ